MVTAQFPLVIPAVVILLVVIFAVLWISHR